MNEKTKTFGLNFEWILNLDFFSYKILTSVFISALSSLDTTENLRKAAPISGSSFDNAALPNRSSDRTKHISLSTCAAENENIMQSRTDFHLALIRGHMVTEFLQFPEL